MRLADPGIPRDTQERESHVEGDSTSDGAKSALTVWKVAGVLPKKMANEWLSSEFVPHCLQIEVLQFSGDPTDVEHTIGPLHPLQINRDDVESISEKKIARRGIAVDEDLLILPHTRLIAPTIPEPVQLISFMLFDEVLASELTHKSVQIRAVVGEVNSIAVRSAIVESGHKVRECSQFCK